MSVLTEKLEWSFKFDCAVFQGKFLATYEKAQEECYLLCIPQSECLHGALITEKFVGKCCLNLNQQFHSKTTVLIKL